MYYVGIDIGGMSIKAGIVDTEGNILIKDSIKTGSYKSYQTIVLEMADLINSLLKKLGISKNDLSGIGIGSPGTPDCKNGRIIYNNNLNFKNVPLRDEMQKYINIPVYVDNDANCAALAESEVGGSKGTKNSVLITLGTGVGGGVIIEGKIYSGFNYAASEIGHTVIEYNGVKCTCGRKGCWEVYASATGLIRMTKETISKNPDSLMITLAQGNLDKIDAKTAFVAKRQRDEAAIEVVEKYTNYLAAGITNVINIFQPEVVLIGGGVSHEGEYLLKPLREKVYSEIYCCDGIGITKIEVARMGNDAGIIGAAMLVKQDN